jgi:hypothetical protein
LTARKATRSSSEAIKVEAGERLIEEIGPGRRQVFELRGVELPSQLIAPADLFTTGVATSCAILWRKCVRRGAVLEQARPFSAGPLMGRYEASLRAGLHASHRRCVLWTMLWKKRIARRYDVRNQELHLGLVLRVVALSRSRLRRTLGADEKPLALGLSAVCRSPSKASHVVSGSSMGAVAGENDYNLLVFNLRELETTISRLGVEVEERCVRERREHLEPNTTDWVNLIALQLSSTTHIFEGLQDSAVRILDSQPGEAVFDAQPPSAPDTPPA